ncbi:MAG: hypothetical protein MZW92_62390 [Comamonadaceae bacterium]|nr:hypothetical protein [Comamonadaceae bacterium]
MTTFSWIYKGASICLRREHRDRGREPARGPADDHDQRAPALRQDLRQGHGQRPGRVAGSSGRSSSGPSASARDTAAQKIRRQPIPWGWASQRKIAAKLVYGKIIEKTGGRVHFFVSGGAPLLGRRGRVLLRHRHHHPRGLRPDRDVAGPGLQHLREDEVRRGRAARPRRRDQDRPGRGDPGQGPERHEGLLQEGAGDPRGLRGRLVQDGRHRPHRRGGLPRHHRPEEGHPGHGRGQERRAPADREPAQDQSLHPDGRRRRRAAGSSSRPSSCRTSTSSRPTPASQRHRLRRAARSSSRRRRSSSFMLAEIDRSTPNLASYERIKKVVLLDREFDADTELTPSLKVKRHIVEKVFKAAHRPPL